MLFFIRGFTIIVAERKFLCYNEIVYISQRKERCKCPEGILAALAEAVHEVPVAPADDARVGRREEVPDGRADRRRLPRLHAEVVPSAGDVCLAVCYTSLAQQGSSPPLRWALPCFFKRRTQNIIKNPPNVQSFSASGGLCFAVYLRVMRL